VRNAGPHPGVGWDAPGGEFDAGGGELQAVHVGLPPGGHQEDIPLDGPRLPFPLRRRHPQQDGGIDDGRLERFRAGPDDDPFALETAPEDRGDIRILVGQQLVAVFDDGDVRPEAPKGLRHLDADRPPAEHQEPSRQLLLREDRLVGPVGNRIDPLDRGEGRARTGGDDPGPCGQARTVQVDRVVVDEARDPEPDLGAELAEPFRGVVRLDRVDHLADAVHDGREAHRRELDVREPELLRAARKRPHPRGTDQRLRWDAPEVEAVAAQGPRLLDEDRLRAELRRAGGRREAGRAAAENPQVVVMRRHAGPPLPFRDFHGVLVPIIRWAGRRRDSHPRC
jgi:hypothetical protein